MWTLSWLKHLPKDPNSGAIEHEIIISQNCLKQLHLILQARRQGMWHQTLQKERQAKYTPQITANGRAKIMDVI